MTQEQAATWYLLKEGEVYETIDSDGGLQRLSLSALTEEAMKTHGFTEAAQLLDVYDQLEETFQLFALTADGNEGVRVGYLPPPQIIAHAEGFDVSAYRQPQGLWLKTSGTGGEIRVAILFNNVNAWYVCHDGQWQTTAFTVEGMRENGMTLSELEEITPELLTLYHNTRIKLGYYLAKENLDDDLAITSLHIAGCTQSWRKAQHMVDYRWALAENGEKLFVAILKNGDYKVNYLQEEAGENR